MIDHYRLTNATDTDNIGVIPESGWHTKSERTLVLEREQAAELPEYPDSEDLEKFTGTKASTWRYWAMLGQGPASFKLGRRRVWRKAGVLAWLAEQETATA